MMGSIPQKSSGTPVSMLSDIKSLWAAFSAIIRGFIAAYFGILYYFYFLAYLIPDKRRTVKR